MSLLYSILKPIVRKVVKGSSLHQEESYEEFKQASYDVQKKFKFALPRINGFEFRDEQLDGFHIIVGKEAGTNPDKAVVYFPGGGFTTANEGKDLELRTRLAKAGFVVAAVEYRAVPTKFPGILEGWQGSRTLSARPCG